MDELSTVLVTRDIAEYYPSCDTKKCIEDINIRKGPLDELNTVLVTRDIVDYYPSCDTRKCIKDINIRKGPLDEFNTILVTMNTVDYYPSCDTKKCIEAVEWVLNEAEESSGADNRSILEAVELTMTSNNCSCLGRHFMQTDGATIGGPAAFHLLLIRIT